MLSYLRNLPSLDKLLYKFCILITRWDLNKETRRVLQDGSPRHFTVCTLGLPKFHLLYSKVLFTCLFFVRTVRLPWLSVTIPSSSTKFWHIRVILRLISKEAKQFTAAPSVTTPLSSFWRLNGELGPCVRQSVHPLPLRLILGPHTTTRLVFSPGDTVGKDYTSKGGQLTFERRRIPSVPSPTFSV